MADAPNALPAAQAGQGRPIAGAGEAEAGAPSEAAMRQAVELEILNALGTVTTRAIGEAIDRAAAAMPEPPIPAAIERLVARVEASPIELADKLIVEERLRQARDLLQAALAAAEAKLDGAEAPDV